MLSEMDKLENHLVPIGFVYTQFPNQTEPSNLWPMYTWEDITGQYAGTFFRAEGDVSLPFNGGIQAEDSPRLVYIKRHTLFDRTLYDSPQWPASVRPEIPIDAGAWSMAIYTGDSTMDSARTFEFLNVLVNDVEVTPRNQAIRIWTRVK
jgi:hypothetical protein